MLGLRLAFTTAVGAIVAWLLSSGRPLGGLVLVPLTAVWLRRAAESGRLKQLAARTLKSS